MASPSAGAPALKYGDVNTVTPSSGEVKGLMKINPFIKNNELIFRNIICNIKYYKYTVENNYL